MVFDGAPSRRLYGVDIVSHSDLRYEYYRDRDRFGATFIQSGLFYKCYPNKDLSKLNVQIDMISFIHVLHQWSWKDQRAALVDIVPLSRPRPGSIVLGLRIGSIAPACYFLEPEGSSRKGRKLPQAAEMDHYQNVLA